MPPTAINYKEELTELFLLAGKVMHTQKQTEAWSLDQNCQPTIAEQPKSRLKRWFQQHRESPWQPKEQHGAYLDLVQLQTSLVRLNILQWENLEPTSETLRFDQGSYRCCQLRSQPSLFIDELNLRQFAGHDSAILRNITCEQDGVVECIRIGTFDGEPRKAWYYFRSTEDHFTSLCYDIFGKDFQVAMFVSSGHLNPRDIEIRIEALRETHKNSPYGIETVDTLLGEVRHRGIANHEMIKSGFFNYAAPELEKITLMLDTLEQFA